MTSRELRLSIFIDEGDHWRHKPLHAEIVHRARKAGLAGATVIRGIEGYGASADIHTTHVFHVGDDLPLLIVIVDAEAKIRAFLPHLEELGIEGLVLLDDVEVVRYAAPAKKHRIWG